MGMKKATLNTILPVPAVPTGVMPVLKSTVKAVESVKERAGDDKILSDRMTKQDWSNKDRAIERVAITKSVLESPLLAQRVIGLNRADAFAEFRAWFNEAIEVFYSK